MASIADSMESPVRYVCQGCGQNILEEGSAFLGLSCPACHGTRWIEKDSPRYDQWIKHEACSVTHVPHHGLCRGINFVDCDGKSCDGSMALWLSDDKIEELIECREDRQVSFYDHGWKRIAKDGEIIDWSDIDVIDYLPWYVSPAQFPRGSWVQFWNAQAKLRTYGYLLVDHLPAFNSLIQWRETNERYFEREVRKYFKTHLEGHHGE